MSDEASPRPWRWWDEGQRMYDANGSSVMHFEDGAGATDDIDAALIVRAVNHHDELVAMVERLFSAAADRGAPWPECFDAARELLKRVRGG